MAQGSRRSASINIGMNDTSPATIVAARTGYAILVLGYTLDVASMGAAWPDGTAATVQFVDDSTSPPNVHTGPMALRPAMPLVVPVSAPTGEGEGGYFRTAASANLQIIAAGAPITGHVTYCYMAQ